jgi:type I restriction enzyme S subunit
MSSEGWQQVAIGDLVDFAIGGGWGEEDDGETPVVVIRGTDIPAVRSGSLSTCPRRFEEKKKAEKRSLVEGDIVFEISGGSQKTGQSTGRPALMTSELVDQAGCTVIPASFCRLIRFKQERVLPSFVYYHLLNLHSSGRAADYEIQSTGISNFQFKEFLRVHPFRLPPIPEQRRIAWVLGTLDAKISLNRKLAQTLEDTAAAIFRARFVDFEGVKEFKDSQIGSIPRGWETGTAGELLRFSGGKRPPLLQTFGSVPVLGANGRMGFCDEPMFSEPITTIGRVGSSGEVHRCSTASWVSDNAIVVRPAAGRGPAFTYFAVRSLEVAPLIGGTTQPLLTQQALKSMPVVIPDRASCEDFERIARPQIDLVDTCLAANEGLSSLRDELLPKLISGKIRVPEGVGPDLDQETTTEVAEELAEA